MDVLYFRCFQIIHLLQTVSTSDARTEHPLQGWRQRVCQSGMLQCSAEPIVNPIQLHGSTQTYPYFKSEVKHRKEAETLRKKTTMWESIEGASPATLKPFARQSQTLRNTKHRSSPTTNSYYCGFQEEEHMLGREQELS